MSDASSTDSSPNKHRVGGFEGPTPTSPGSNLTESSSTLRLMFSHSIGLPILLDSLPVHDRMTRRKTVAHKKPENQIQDEDQMPSTSGRDHVQVEETSTSKEELSARTDASLEAATDEEVDVDQPVEFERAPFTWLQRNKPIVESEGLEKEAQEESEDDDKDKDSPSSTIVRPNWLASPKKFESIYSSHIGFVAPEVKEKFVIPSPGTAITQTTDNTFAVYKAALDISLRFPLSSFIINILKAYGIGIAQLTPQSWCHILAYMAVCRVRGWACLTGVFLRMHQLTKNSRCKARWFQLSHRDKYMTTITKPNKIYNWKSDFFLVYTKDTLTAQILSTWTTYQNTYKESELSARTAEVERQLAYFKSTDYKYPKFERTVKVPKNWLPIYECFCNTDFMRAFGLAGGRKVTNNLRGSSLILLIMLVTRIYLSKCFFSQILLVQSSLPYLVKKCRARTIRLSQASFA